MKIINFKNVEDLIFKDTNLFNKLSSVGYKNYFYQWKLSIQSPALRQLGKKSLLDFLNVFPLDQSHQDILETHFDDKVKIQKLNYNIVENYKIPLNEACDKLCEIENFGYFETARDGNYLYISFWR